MALLKWNPFVDIVTLQERMSRIFDGEAAGLKDRMGGLTKGAWAPLIDIFETEDKLLLNAELPGVNLKDVDVEVDKNVLIIRGFRRFEKNINEENYLRMERYYGTFQRVFSLPAFVDKANVKANLKDGVLRITLPKVEPLNAKRISVESS